MRAVVQRVLSAKVIVGESVSGEIGPGLLILLGVAATDGADDADRLARKISRLRIFESGDGALDLSILESGGRALVVSQFTLLAELSRGNRPSFSDAAPAPIARPLYDRFCASLEGQGLVVATGVFGARMQVELVNDGPVTIILG